MKEAHEWHKRLTGTGIGERTQTFLRGLKWTLPAAFIARLFAGLATMLTARHLGPAEFGRASLVLATTLWVQVPLFLGLPTALMRFVPSAKQEEREKWVSTGLCLLTGAAVVTLVLGVGLSGFWAGLQGVSADEFQLGLLWCAAFLFFTAATFLSAAHEKFRIRAILEVCFASFFLTAVAVLWFSNRLNAAFYVLAMAFAYAVVGVAGLLGHKPKHFFQNGFGERARALLIFGLIASGGSIAGALLQSMGRLIANRYLDISQVGILSAYQAGSLQVALYFVGYGIQVFVPVAARTPDRSSLFGKLTRLSLPLIGGTSLACGAALAAYFLLLGRRYHLGLAELAIFAVASGLLVQHGVLSWFFSSGGSRGLVSAVIVGLVAGILNALLGWLWIPHWGVFGAGAAIAAAYSGGILACYIPSVRRYGAS